MSLAVILMLLVSLAACGKTDDAEHLGNNFKIVDIDYDQMMLTVEDMSNPPIIEEKFNLQCEDVPIIYCNYEKDLESLKDEDSDKILKVTQIQLGTQRLN